MTFAHPYFLLLLLLLPIVAWLKGKRGQQSAFLYSSVQLVRPVANISQWSPGRVLLALRWLVLAALIIGLAQPQLTRSETAIRASGIDIVVALDLSGSMAAEDEGFRLHGQQVNRVAIAKDVLQKFIAKRPNDRIGLVAFGDADANPRRDGLGCSRVRQRSGLRVCFGAVRKERLRSNPLTQDRDARRS